MTIQEIPLTADNQQFSIVLGGVTWRISIIWRDLYWIMDLQNDRGEPVISGIPLVTGADLLAQYACNCLQLFFTGNRLWGCTDQ
ncbi:TPA: hypothetical protein ACH7AF_005090 [Escherichia coli]